jgi:hypothetical protein
MLQAAPELAGHRFTNLLNFESQSETAFFSPSATLTATLDESRAHTGRSCLRLSASPDQPGDRTVLGGTLTVKLASVQGAQAFPGGWTLVGAYFYAEKPAQVVVTCDIPGGKTIAQSVVPLRPGQWTPVMADLANFIDPQEVPTSWPLLNFHLNAAASGDIWCDDVALIDNTQWIVGTEESSVRPSAWSVCRRGLKIVCGNSDRFAVRLTPSDIAADGWTMEEANAFRVRFNSVGPEHKTLTIYPDGRSYWDGEYRPLAGELRSQPFWAAEHGSPAEIQVPESVGRLNRTSPGDANNDGYNEARATYMVIARRPRLSVSIIPRSAPIVEPMLEITGLPLGNALVTIEGQLVERTLRLDDGTLLIALPGKIERPTSVNVSVR